MRWARTIAAAALLNLSGGGSAVAQVQDEQVIAVPGFADFLAVDGSSVWATNAGRVERWSRDGKLASVPVGKPCGAMVIDGGALWVADCKNGSLVRIDTATATATDTVATGIANPLGELNVVAGAGSIWIASDNKGMVSRVDPATRRVIATVPVTPGTHYLAFGFGSLWSVSSAGRTLQRIDPATDKVTQTIALGNQPGFLAAGEGAVWVQEQGDGTVARVDPATNAVSGRVKVGAKLAYGDIDTGGGSVWLRTTEDQTFVVIDPRTLAIRSRVGKAVGSGALRFTPEGIWTSAHDNHTLSWWRHADRIGK